MAFYWQSGVAGGEAAATESPWAHISLGGPADPHKYSWTQQQAALQQNASVVNGYEQDHNPPAQPPVHQEPVQTHTSYQPQQVQQYTPYDNSSTTVNYCQQNVGYPNESMNQPAQSNNMVTTSHQPNIEHAPLLPKKPEKVRTSPPPRQQEYYDYQQHSQENFQQQYQQQAQQQCEDPAGYYQQYGDPLSQGQLQQTSHQDWNGSYAYPEQTWHQEQRQPESQQEQQYQQQLQYDQPAAQAHQVKMQTPNSPQFGDSINVTESHDREVGSALTDAPQREEEAIENPSAPPKSENIDMPNAWNEWENTEPELTERTPELSQQAQSEPPIEHFPAEDPSSREISEPPSHYEEPVPVLNETTMHPVQLTRSERRPSHTPSVASERDSSFPVPSAAEPTQIAMALADDPQDVTSECEATSAPNAALDIQLPNSSDAVERTELQPQLSDTQNSDRTSEGFVKVPDFPQQNEMDPRAFSATNTLFSEGTQWPPSAPPPAAPPARHPAPSAPSFTPADYQEQDANDSATSSVLPTNNRNQIVANYMEYRKRLPTIVNRRNASRSAVSAVGVSSPRGHANPLFEEGRRSVISRVANNASVTRPLTSHYEGGALPARPPTNQENADRLNTSLLTNPDGPLDMSFDSPQSPGYGEGFVEHSRRSRLFRSGTASRGPASEAGFEQRYASRHMHHNRHEAASGRRSVSGFGDVQHVEPSRRRPQSSYDPRAMTRMERSGVPMEQYDVFNSPGVSSDSADGGDCSDAEMAQYHSQSHSQFFSQTEMYLIGSLRVNPSKFVNTVRKFPPPPDYYRLRPVERVAFVFYTALWQRNYSDIAAFHKKFNRDFYTLTAAGIDDEEALYRICAQLQEKHMQVRKEHYTNTQKQLFSDERGSSQGEEEERLSERGSVYERPDETDDVASVDAYSGPLKFRTPHAFATFGPGGRMLVLNPNVSVAAIEVTDVRSVLKDEQSVRLMDVIQMFRGPLTALTPPHQVTLYIRRQIDRIMHSDVAQENPHDNDVTDCLLIWQLLQIVVQQHGKVTGPDIARLLMEAAPAEVVRREQLMAAHRERSATPTQKPATQTDPRVHDKFTQYLLAGHIEEAIDLALRHGMFADAMVLARRVDPAKLPAIEERYMAAMSQRNPVTTLLAVASNQPAPILINPPTDDGGSWRAHAAVVLANLNTESAMTTVYQLGRVLAQREYRAAADFCLLAVALLTSFDPFQPVPQPVDADPSVRQHVSLIHASLPDDEHDSTQCRFGFSLTDLHATEIFAYGVSLAKGMSSLAASTEYQVHRIQYAKLLSEYGFVKAAFTYCTDIALQIGYASVPLHWLLELCETADRVRVSSEEPAENATWIERLREIAAHAAQHDTAVRQPVQQQPVAQPQQTHHQTPQSMEQVQPVLHHAHPDISHNSDYHQQPHVPSAESVPAIPHPEAHQTYAYEQSQQVEPPQQRSRVASISSEAADWHSKHQEPIQLPQSPDRRTSVSSQASAAPWGQNHQTLQTVHGHHAPPPFSPADAQQEALEEIGHPTSPHRSASPVAAPTMQIFPEIPQPVHPVQPQPELIVPQPPAPAQMPHLEQQRPVAAHQTTEISPGAAKSVTQQQQLMQPNKENKLKKSSSSTGSSKGLFSTIIQSTIQSVTKRIPSSNEMKLPEDDNKTIVWDSILQRYVGEGLNEEPVAAPPPVAPQAAPSAPIGPAAGLRGVPRYFNGVTGSAAPASVSAPIPAMPIPQFTPFIPKMPDSEDVGDSPFSEAAPTDSQGQAQEAN